MRWLLRLSIMLVSSLVFGQNCTCYVVVAAYDQKTGLDLEKLKTQDFEVTLGHRSLPVVSASQEFTNRLLVLLETDGSSNNTKLSEVSDVVGRWVREIPDGRPIAFGVFAERAVFTKGFNDDQEKRRKELSAVLEEADSLGKRSALFDALHDALAMFPDHQPGDTVLLISDGFDDMSHHSPSDIEKEFAAKGVRLFFMLRRPPSRVERDTLWIPHHEREILERTTNETGGAYSGFSPPFFRFAWAGYLLGIRVPTSIIKPSTWKLRVRRPDAGYWKANLYYPQKLTPCGNPEAAKSEEASK